MLIGAYRPHAATLKAAFSTTVTKKSKEELQKKIVDAVNETGGNERTWQDCQTKLKNMSSTTKSKERHFRQEVRKTGGGSSTAKPLTEPETLLLSTFSQIDFNGVEGGIDLHRDIGKRRVITTL